MMRHPRIRVSVDEELQPIQPSKLAIEHVSKSFQSSSGHVQALEDVSLSVGEGEFVCLLGASGCGKSTLLNIIAGLTPPTSGEVAVSSRRPALMFQEPALLPWLTAAGNVELALRARGVGRAERREEARRLLSLV